MRRLAVVCILIAVVTGLAFAQHVPIFTQGQVELQSRAQLVGNIGSWDLLAEMLGMLHDTNTPLQSYESVTVGGYYRVIPAWLSSDRKLGVHAEKPLPLRHMERADVRHGST